MSRLLDFILGCFKWPVALFALFSLPALCQALHYFQFGSLHFFVFLAGCFIYLALKIVAAARTNVSMQILTHEFTHIFFALLTFHKVVHIHLNVDESGGAMGFKGKGNWLIVVGPYFFPLFLFFVMLGITFFSDRLPEGYWLNGFLGYLFAYHVESVVVETHAEQPDFKEVGFPFCWMFLPSANLFMCSVVLAFNNGGWLNVLKYMQGISYLNRANLQWILNYFTN